MFKTQNSNSSYESDLITLCSCRKVCEIYHFCILCLSTLSNILLPYGKRTCCPSHRSILIKIQVQGVKFAQKMRFLKFEKMLTLQSGWKLGCCNLPKSQCSAIAFFLPPIFLSSLKSLMLVRGILFLQLLKIFHLSELELIKLLLQ